MFTVVFFMVIVIIVVSGVLNARASGERNADDKRMRELQLQVRLKELEVQELKLKKLKN